MPVLPLTVWRSPGASPAKKRRKSHAFGKGPASPDVSKMPVRSGTPETPRYSELEAPETPRAYSNFESNFEASNRAVKGISPRAVMLLKLSEQMEAIGQQLIDMQMLLQSLNTV